MLQTALVIFIFLVFVSTSNSIFSIFNCRMMADGLQIMWAMWPEDRVSPVVCAELECRRPV